MRAYKPAQVAALLSSLSPGGYYFTRPSGFGRTTLLASLASALSPHHYPAHVCLEDYYDGAASSRGFITSLSYCAPTAASKPLIRASKSPSAALGALISALPPSQPLALLLDGYDCAVRRAVQARNWRQALSARAVTLPLLTLAASHPRVSYIFCSGTTQFPPGELTPASFTDLTSHPHLCAAMGITPSEISSLYPTELSQFAAATQCTPSQALLSLERWYGGLSFDGGVSSSLCPTLVQRALFAGCHRPRSGLVSYWLGVPTSKLWREFTHTPALPASAGLASLSTRSVNASAVMVQAGILTTHANGCLTLPNAYSASLLASVANDMAGAYWDAREVSKALKTALAARDAAALRAALQQAVQSASSSRRPCKPALLQPALTLVLTLALQGGVGSLEPPVGGCLRVRLQATPSQPSALWVLHCLSRRPTRAALLEAMALTRQAAAHSNGEVLTYTLLQGRGPGAPHSDALQQRSGVQQVWRSL